jgi:hexosaminidase
MTPNLLPQPKKWSSRAGTFSFDMDIKLLIPAGADEAAFAAARQIQDEAIRTLGMAPPIVKAIQPPQAENVILLLCGPQEAQAFGAQVPQIDAPPAVADQSYALDIRRGRIVLYAPAPAGRFYAAQTLRQLIRLQGYDLRAGSIRDWPSMPYRGLMLDVSRGKVPTVETLKELALELSHYKLNVLQLYTEHTFDFPRHPQIGMGCDPLDSEDMLELDAHCRELQVELIPNLQSLGHQRHLLSLPGYQHLAEAGLAWSLSPAYEETYALLAELYEDLLPSFTSSYFNVNCDESYDVGQGASKEMADQLGPGRVYLNHLLRLRELAARHGKQLQIWGDIILHHPDLLGEIPEDITWLDWEYAPQERYETLDKFAAAGRRFWVCPGVGSWNSIFPRLYDANINIRNFVRDGLNAGAEGVLNTDWGDYGHYQPLGLSWYGYVYGAAQSWTGAETDDEEFEAAFGLLFFQADAEPIMEALHQLARTNTLPNVYRHNRSATILALFDEPLTGETVVEGEARLAPATLEEMRDLADAAGLTLEALALDHPRELTLREMAFAARLTSYAARKTAAFQAIRAALRDIAAHPEPVAARSQRLAGHILTVKDLSAELEALRGEFELLWFARARRSEIHISLGYFASLRARYEAALSWLEAQRRGLVNGRSVDADLATYDAGHHLVLWQRWQAERNSYLSMYPTEPTQQRRTENDTTD